MKVSYKISVLYFSNSTKGNKTINNILCMCTQAVNTVPKWSTWWRQEKTSIVTNPKIPPTKELRMIRTFCSPSHLINSRGCSRFLHTFQDSTHYNVLNVAESILISNTNTVTRLICFVGKWDFLLSSIMFTWDFSKRSSPTDLNAEEKSAAVDAVERKWYLILTTYSFLFLFKSTTHYQVEFSKCSSYLSKVR